MSRFGRHSHAVVTVFSALGIMVSYFYYKDHYPDWDEMIYVNFITVIKKLILSNNLNQVFSLYKSGTFSQITSLPTYFVAAAYLHVLSPTWQALRMINVVLSIAGVFLWGRFLRELYGRTDEWKRLQLVFLPVVFILIFLIYNDYTSFFFIILALLFELRRRPLASTSCLAIAVAIRQSVAPWIIFVPVLVQAHRQEPWNPKLSLNAYMQKSMLLFLVGLFFIKNHGVSMGARELQVTGKINLLNLSNFYIFSGIFLFPGILTHLKQHLVAIRKKWTFILLVLSWVVYQIGLKQQLHFCNTWIQHRGTYLIRNIMVHYQKEQTLGAAIGFTLMTLGFLEWKRLIPRDVFIFLTLASISSLVPYNIIDIRYAIIPLFFHVLFSNEPSLKIKRIQTLWFVGISVCWLILVRRNICTPF